MNEMKVTTGQLTLSAALFLSAALCAGPCHAQDSVERSLLEDSKLYFTAPLHWNQEHWAYFAGTVATIAVAHEFDATVRHAFEPTGGHQPLDGADPNSTRDAIPAVALLAGTWVIGAIRHDAGQRGEAWSMAEAAGFSAVDTFVLKYAAGRLRPNETTHVDSWFESGDSFPSMHTSVAFAVGTVLAESGDDEHRWARRLIGYGVAGATAYARLHDNVHWFSDVVAGGAIGMASARFVINRDAERAGTRHTAISVVPLDRGVMLTWYLVPTP